MQAGRFPSARFAKGIQIMSAGKKASGPRVCAYGCQVTRDNPMTKEHFWAWMRRLDLGIHIRTIHTTSRNLIEEIPGSPLFGAQRKKRAGAPLHQSGRVGWEDGNRTGMSRVQEACKPILRPMIKEHFRKLNASQCLAIARFAVLFTMTYEFADDTHTMVSSQADRIAFKQTLNPPENWIIAVAPYNGANLDGNIFHASGNVLPSHLPNLPFAMPKRRNAQTTTFVIGKLVIHTLTKPIWLDVDAGAYGADIGATVIFPRQGRTDLRDITPFNQFSLRDAHMQFWARFGSRVPIIL
jgi:hypothetical protein